MIDVVSEDASGRPVALCTGRPHFKQFASLINQLEDSERNRGMLAGAHAPVIPKLGVGLTDYEVRDDDLTALLSSVDNMAGRPAVMPVAAIDGSDK